MYFATAYVCIFSVSAVLVPYVPILLREIGYSPSRVGILLGIFDGAGIAGPFIFSYWADKKREYKTSLVVSHILVFLPFIPLIMNRNIFLAIILMMITGIGYRSIFPLLDAATTAGIGPDGNFGKIKIGGVIGFLLTVFILQVTPFLQPKTPLTIAFWIWLTVLLSMITVIVIPSTYTTIGKQKNENQKEQKYSSSLLVLGLFMIALSRLGLSPVMSLFSLFLTEYVHFNAVGFMWIIACLSEIPFMLLSKRLINRFGSLHLLMVCIFSLSIRLLICAVFPTVPGVIISQLFHSISYGLFYITGVAFILDCVPSSRRALGMSLFISLGFGLPSFAGNILGGFVIEQLGYRSLFGIFALFPVLSLVIYIPYYIYYKKNGRRG